MSDIPRRPPNDGIPEDLRQEEGYLLREGLPRETTERIGAVLDRAVRARASSRRRWQVAASLGVATVAIAAIVGILRAPPEEAPEPPPESPVVAEAPRPEAPPPPPPVPRPHEREASPPPPPSRESLPVEAPAPEPVPAPDAPAAREEPRVPLASAPTPPPPPTTLGESGTYVPGRVEDLRVVRLHVKRTDDPTRDPIAMTIRYRAPSGRPGKESRP